MKWQNIIYASCFIILVSISPVASFGIANTPWVPPTNAYAHAKFPNGTTVNAKNYDATLDLSSLSTGNSKGTYNKTLANNVVVNSGGNRINYINGTNSTVKVVNDPTRNQVNITISSSGGGGGSGSITGSHNGGKGTNSVGTLATGTSTQVIGRNFTGVSPVQVTKTNDTDASISCPSCLTSAITSLNFTTNPDFDFHSGNRNVTYTTLDGQVFNLHIKPNVILSNETAQTIFKALTLNSGILGGNLITTGFGLSNAGHVSTPPLTTGTLCQTNQTTSCGAADGLISINADTTPAQLITGSSGNITITDTGATHNVNTGNDVPHQSKFNNFTNNNSLANSTKLYFDGGKNTYITRSTANAISVFTNGREHVRIDDGSNNALTTNQATFGDLTTNSSLISTNAAGSFLSPGTFGVKITTHPVSASGQLQLRDLSSFTSMILPTNNELLGEIDFQGIRTTAPLFVTTARISATASEGWASTATGTNLGLFTTSSGTTTTAEKLRLTNNGDVGMQSTNQFHPDGVAATGDTYITESSANVLDTFVGGTNILKLKAASATFADKLINTALADPAAAAGQFWLSSTTTDALKYSSSSTIYTILSTKLAVNATTGHTTGNSTATGSTTQKMLGDYATITPRLTGNIAIHVSGYWDNAVVNDGCRADVRIGTTNLGANAAALTGTLVGTNWKMIGTPASGNQTFAKVVYSSGNAVGTKLFVDLSFNTLVGGSCTIRNVDWLLSEMQ